MSEPVIVVTLDGSELSESALPHAVAMAKLMESSLFLTTVWEGNERELISTLPAVAEDLTQQREQVSQDYLDKLAQRVVAEGVEVETAVLIGEPGDEVLRLLDEREPRMLVLATHGRSGVSRWLFGSVAHELIREAPVATLVVGPKAKAPAKPIARILVPLDSSPLSESALDPAVELAARLGARVTLAEVIQVATQAVAFGVPPVYVPGIEEAMLDAAKAYLSAIDKRLGNKVPVDAVVLRGSPADALVTYIEQEQFDLVVMASHSRSGLARTFLGSVAGRMLEGAAPVLLVRPERVTQIVRARRGRYCHACGRAVAYVEVMAEDRCTRCDQHLRACANCVYSDGLACLLQRSEVHEPYPGQHCPAFQFRETEPSRGPASKGDK
jgi:nucleotide-binding universal stress UspA family protein